VNLIIVGLFSALGVPALFLCLENKMGTKESEKPQGTVKNKCCKYVKC